MHEGYLKKKDKFWLCCDNLVLLNQRLYVCFVISSSICYWLFKCGVLHVVCVCMCARVRERDRVTSLESAVLTAACVQTHKSFISVCFATLFLFRAWTDGNTNLEAEACDYGKERYISDACLWCSANHNALCQLANQSRLHLLEGGAL